MLHQLPRCLLQLKQLYTSVPQMKYKMQPADMVTAMDLVGTTNL
jgi:hypothetical protein